MADEVRRSGRATKGQHTKNLDVPETPTPAPAKRGGKGSQVKSSAQNSTEPTPPPDEDADAIIRCICGYVEEDEEDDRVMIVCDNCEAWQHNECMEISENPDDLPDQYFCEQCKPEDHKELLTKVARGEKPWEERVKQRELQEEERKARRRKGGKKGKKGRASGIKADVKPDVKPDVAGESAKINGTPVTKTTSKAVAKPTAGPVVGLSVDVAHLETKTENSQKRKLPEETTGGVQDVDQQEPQSKIRKMSSPVDGKPLAPPDRRKSTIVATPAKTPSKRDSRGMVLQTELVENISDLQSEARRKIANALVKLFIDQTQQAQKQGTFKLPQGQSQDAFGLTLGLGVEYAVYLNFWGHSAEPSTLYGDKFRMINHNVKANPALRDRLLSGSLSPNDFSKMSSFDMASKELQAKTEEMKKEAEKQHIAIQEEGPRIRRTHKGEELVNDESHTIQGSDTSFIPAPVRRRDSEIDSATPRQASPPAMSPPSPAAVEPSESMAYPATASSPTGNAPLTADTKPHLRPSGPPDRKSASAFNIHNVWSSVSGPAAEGQRVPEIPRGPEFQHTPVQAPSKAVEADADIDQLLKDEEPEEEEPYSPTDYTADPDSSIWRGKMSMSSIADFEGKARHVAGANLSATFPWTQLIPSTLSIEGRIDTERASKYLCGLRWSRTTDVSVVAVTPIDDPSAKAQFDKLFRYFTERNRYGVIGKSPVAAVKDTYLVPLEAGMSKKPDFIELLEYCTIEDPSPERMLLLTFVIKSNNSPSAQATPRHLDAAAVASPIGPGAASQAPFPVFQAPISMDPSGAHGSPTPSQFPTQPPHMAPYGGSPVPPQSSTFMPPAHHQPYQQPYPMSTGIDAARQALGELANVPAVGELLAEAPNTGVPEFHIIREVLESVPAARNDFQMLKGLLTVKHQQGGQ